MHRANFGVTIGWGQVSEYVSSAKFLEGNRYDSFWLSDETMVFGSPPDVSVPDIFPTMGIVASATSRLEICAAVLDASIRFPVKTAQSIATVDAISGGRTKFGIGAGEAVNREPFGVPVGRNFARMKEAVDCIKLLFGSSPESPVNYSGEFFSLSNAFLKIRPTRRPHPPLIISAFGPRSLEFAGQVGDGWISYNHTPKTFSEALNGPVRKGAEQVGKSTVDLETTLVFSASLHKDRDTARKIAGGIAREWLVWSPDNLGRLIPDFQHPGQRETYIKRPGEQPVKMLSDLARTVPEEIAASTTVSGDDEDCISTIESFIKSGCKNFIFYITPVEGGWEDAVREFSRRVLASFEQQRGELYH